MYHKKPCPVPRAHGAILKKEAEKDFTTRGDLKGRYIKVGITHRHTKKNGTVGLFSSFIIINKIICRGKNDHKNTIYAAKSRILHTCRIIRLNHGVL